MAIFITNEIPFTPIPLSTTSAGAIQILTSSGWATSSGTGNDVYMIGVCRGSSTTTPDTSINGGWRIFWISPTQYTSNQAGIAWRLSNNTKYWEQKIEISFTAHTIYGDYTWYKSPENASSYNGQNFYTGYNIPVIYASPANTSYNDILSYAVEKIIEASIPKDPYANGGTSTSGGGGGSFDDSTDVIQIPSYDPVELLNRGYANRGFVSVYLPTQAQVLSLSNYLWSSGIDTTLKKLYADPIQSIISLSMIPLVITGTNTGNIYIAHTDTEISGVMLADNQFVTLDCGTIDLDEFWGSYLDYSPYTKLSIYLPFIGVRALNIDEFMSGTIEVKYVIDIISGDCIAFISRVGSTDNLTVPVPAILGVLYQFNGNVSLQVPISAANFAQMYGASISAAVGGVGMLAGAVTGGLSAPMAVAGIAATAVNVASSKPSISHGGAIPSTAGWLGVQKPYLILQRPQQCLPEDQNTLTGYPAYVTVTIGDVEGYNEFEIMHLENIPATEQEKDEIERLLKSGVIL